MRYGPCALALALILTPELSSARKKSTGKIPESLVNACLERCEEASRSCGQRAREGEEGQGQKGKGRRARGRRGLRTCGCAYVRCKLMCRSHAWFDAFICTASSRPSPPPAPRSKDRDCRRDRDCTLVSRTAPCSCPRCGVYWRLPVNRKTLRAWRSEWARRRCAARVCPPCASWALGESAYCDDGQCRVRP
jgi:hypothetical protein